MPAFAGMTANSKPQGYLRNRPPGHRTCPKNRKRIVFLRNRSNAMYRVGEEAAFRNAQTLNGHGSLSKTVYEVSRYYDAVNSLGESGVPP